MSQHFLVLSSVACPLDTESFFQTAFHRMLAREKKNVGRPALFRDRVEGAIFRPTKD